MGSAEIGGGGYRGTLLRGTLLAQSQRAKGTG